MKKKKHVVLRIVGILLALVLLCGLTLTLIPLTETVETKTVPGSADWMSRLRDDIPLNELVLPGTHDSATQYVQLAFFSKCQALSVGEQLEAGFRYLDIRLGVQGADMKLMHGFTSCKTGPYLWDDPLYFSRVLEDCVSFLRQHPTETVILAVKQEHGEESPEEFSRVLLGLLERYRDALLLADEIPTLGQARGRLVLLRRYEDQQGLPLLWPNQSGHEDVSRHIEMTDQGAYRLWVQDRYEYGTQDKWNAFLAGQGEAGVAREDLAIHFLSTKGTFAYGHPYGHARDLNSRLLALPSRDLKGWIILDFGNPELARHVWSANFPEESGQNAP